MKSNHDVFIKTLKTGERLFNLHYTDYEDAYSFSEKNFSVHTEHLLDFFQNHTSRKKEEYEADLLRYIFIKAIEHRISADIFGNTSRGNVCDVFYSPFDIALKRYPTNLPLFLEDLVNSFQDNACSYRDEILNLESKDKEYVLNSGMLNAVMFVGMTIGYPYGKLNLLHKDYKTADLLTRNEINQLAVHVMCNWFAKNGYEIIDSNDNRETAQNIVMSKDNVEYHALIAAEIAPVQPGFIQQDMDRFYLSAKESGAIPLAVSINFGSADKKHFDDGVILYNDQTMYSVLSVIEVEAEDESLG